MYGDDIMSYHPVEQVEELELRVRDLQLRNQRLKSQLRKLCRLLNPHEPALYDSMIKEVYGE